MAEKGYGEVKARANIFPSDIDKFSEQGVGIVLVQAKASSKTKQKAEEKGIKLYDDLSPEKVKEVREKVKKGKLEVTTMLDITFYKKQINDNFVPCTIELCGEDYEKLIVSNFAKSFHPEKQCLKVEEEEYSIDAVYCDSFVLEEAKEICNGLLFEELEKVQNYCSRIDGENINKSKLNFMFVLRDVLSSLGECQYFSYV